jgi:fluoride exporter
VTAVLVVLGGAVGAVVRHLVARLLDRPGAPWGVLAANVAGSFLLGVVLGRAPSEVAALVGTGFCGALTTYSTFTLQIVALPRARAVGYALGSVVAGLLAAAVGLAVGS